MSVKETGSGLQSQKQLNPTAVEALTVLYTNTNSYILQYRQFAFQAGVYTVGLLGGCIGLALNDRFKSLWSEKTRGFLLAVLLIFSAVATTFICIVNHKCILYKERRTRLEQVLGFCNSDHLGIREPLITGSASRSVGGNWKYAAAFCLLIGIVTFLAMVAFAR